MEINQNLTISPEEKQMLVMHSAVNVLNAILNEVVTLFGHYGENPFFILLHDRIIQAADWLRKKDSSEHLMQNIQEFTGWAMDQLEAWLESLARISHRHN
jgi:hypothetical protein